LEYMKIIMLCFSKEESCKPIKSKNSFNLPGYWLCDLGEFRA
jgi:hypothetical protein